MVTKLQLKHQTTHGDKTLWVVKDDKPLICLIELVDYNKEIINLFTLLGNVKVKFKDCFISKDRLLRYLNTMITIEQLLDKLDSDDPIIIWYEDLDINSIGSGKLISFGDGKVNLSLRNKDPKISGNVSVRFEDCFFSKQELLNSLN